MSTALVPISAPVFQPAGKRNAEVGLAVAVLAIVALLMVPLPGMILDLLLATSIGTSLVVLLVALNTTDPLEFSSFPSLLLLLTLFRLALNVCSTRLILSTGQAGAVIESFGKFVIGGNYAVGLVLFMILVGINFIVITKGAGRVAEVAARFTLDAMPGKQMAIDADLSAGLIDENEANEAPRRHLAAGGLLRRDGRLVEVREGRRDCGTSHHGDQHRRRHFHRRLPARTAAHPGRLAVHDSHRSATVSSRRSRR